MNTDIATVSYSETETALAELRAKYSATVFDVTTGKGMTCAKEARAELRGCRVRLEEARKAKKADALEYGRKVDSAAKALLSELEALEDPIDAQIKAEEQRKEREKAEREQREKDAVEARTRRFNEIRELPLQAVGASAEGIMGLLARAEALDLGDIEPEFRDAARYQLGLSILSIRAALDRRNLEDEKAAQVAKDLAELETLRAANAEAQRKADEAAQAARDKTDAEIKAVREAQEREDAQKRAEEAEAARVERERIAAEQKAESDRLAAEQKKLAEQRAKLEADKRAAAKKARDAAVASATIYEAAAEASEFLKSKGFGAEIVVEKLDAALSKKAKAA